MDIAAALCSRRNQALLVDYPAARFRLRFFERHELLADRALQDWYRHGGGPMS